MYTMPTWDHRKLFTKNLDFICSIHTSQNNLCKYSHQTMRYANQHVSISSTRPAAATHVIHRKVNWQIYAEIAKISRLNFINQAGYSPVENSYPQGVSTHLRNSLVHTYSDRINMNSVGTQLTYCKYNACLHAHYTDKWGAFFALVRNVRVRFCEAAILNPTTWKRLSGG